MIVLSRKAADDLRQWIDRLANDNPVAAEGFLIRIRKSIQMIEEHPESGHKHPRRDIRYVVESPLKIFYSVEGESVRILRFWHSARNPKSIRYE